MATVYAEKNKTDTQIFTFSCVLAEFFASGGVIYNACNAYSKEDFYGGTDCRKYIHVRPSYGLSLR